MREPTREEWASWAAAIEEKQPPKYYSFLQLLGAETPEAQAARMLQQAAAMQSMAMQSGMHYGNCPCCGRGYSSLGGLFSSIFG